MGYTVQAVILPHRSQSQPPVGNVTVHCRAFLWCGNVFVQLAEKSPAIADRATTHASLIYPPRASCPSIPWFWAIPRSVFRAGHSVVRCRYC